MPNCNKCGRYIKARYHRATGLYYKCYTSKKKKGCSKRENKNLAVMLTIIIGLSIYAIMNFIEFINKHKVNFIIGGIVFVIVCIILLIKLLPKYLKKRKEFKYKVISAIKDFSPSQRWKTEEGYHGELQGWLKAKYPHSKVEIQRGSSRPDILINDIAIEVKGPTTHNGLDTIASKCMRYKNHFKDGFIVVLFDISVIDRMYNEWKNSLLNTFPETIIIRK